MTGMELIERLRKQHELGIMGLPDDWEFVHYAEAADALTALKQENDDRAKCLDELEAKYGMPWRFWSDKARQLADKLYDANTRAETAEARILVLEDALRPFAEDDGMVGVNSDYTNAHAVMKAKP